ncbi:terminase small subunit [Caudoviricetes sp.]|nr:terminase small subunit [Caudoviricetes sp.]
MNLMLKAMESFKQETADIVLERIASGDSIPVLVDEGILPNQSVVWLWARANKAFGLELKVALETSAHVLVHQGLDISNNLSINPKHKILAMDYRQFMASKYAPTIYGNQQVQVMADSVDELGADELEQRRIDLMNEVAEIMKRSSFTDDEDDTLRISDETK